MTPRLERIHRICYELGFFFGISFLIAKRFKKNKLLKFSNTTYPIYLRPRTTDEKVFWQIFVYKEYNIKLDKEPATIIDGGANIGLATVFFKNRFPNAKIIAIEPDSENAEMVKLNTEKYDNVYVKKAALWPNETQIRIVDKMKIGKWALTTEEFNDHNEEEALGVVDTVTINGIMKEFNIEYIDLLKLDIESAEKELFSDNYMTWLPKTKIIIIELHDWMKDGCSQSFFTAINSTFKNYSVDQIGENTIIINKDLL